MIGLADLIGDRHLCSTDIYLTLFVCVAALAVVRLWKKWKAIGANPFLCSSVRTCGVHEVNRHKLLTTRFKPARVPDDLDAIVIGSGMGGLASAGCLARAGKKVLVLEQHDRAGGSTHTFSDKGFEFDVGVHYVGEMNHGSMNHTLMDVLTDGKLVWDEMDEEFDTVVLCEQGQPHKYFSYHAGKKHYKNRLVKYFPEEEKTITEFLRLIEQSRAAIVGYTVMKLLPKWLLQVMIKTGLHNFLFSKYDDMVSKTVEVVLNELTDNNELKFVLGYSFGDHGSFPSEAPFLIHGNLMKHFLDGAYYPRGGASELALNMVPGILRAGGAVLVTAPVSKIICEASRISGVCVLQNGTEYEVKAPIVISSVGLKNTYQVLLTKDISEKHDLSSICDKVDEGLACFQTFIGLSGTAEELALKRRNYWVCTCMDVERSMKEYLSLPLEDAVNADVPLAFISFPSAKDSTWNKRHPDKSVCVVVTFLNWDWFKKWKNGKVMKRGNVYDDLKRSFQEQVWKVVLDVYPQLRLKVEFIDSGTPLSHQYYIGSHKGNIYGINHTIKRFQHELGMELRPETRIPGLFMAGQDVFTCGVMGATLSGMITSGAILGRNHFLDLFALMGRRKAQRYLCCVRQKVSQII